MIVVTGSMRSGTSAWMQILAAAGYPYIGEAFAAHWGDDLRARNPKGFFESQLVAGIYFATNPHPETGHFLRPGKTSRHAVKVFVPGLVRSDFAYLDRVIATVRNWRCVAASHQLMPKGSERGLVDVSVPLIWWLETYALVRDTIVRGYPSRIITYDRLMRDPAAEITPVLDWIGGEHDLAAAIGAVDGSLNRSKPSPDAEVAVDGALATLMDELYERLDNQRPLDGAFLAEMDEMQRRIQPVAQAASHAASQQMFESLSAEARTQWEQSAR